MVDRSVFRLRPDLPLRAVCAGLFVSRGKGTHPTLSIATHELIFVRSGRLDMFEDDRRFIVRAGEALHLWPGRRHGGSAPYPADLSFYWLHFRTVAGLRRAGGGRAGLLLPQHTTVHRPDRLIEFMRRFLDDGESGRMTPLSGSLLVTLIIEELSGAGQPAGRTAASGAEALVVRAEEFILRHFHEAISAWDVAQHLGCNPDYLGRLFRRVRRATLTEVITWARLRHARQLLMDGALGIDEVARAAGFSEAGYFRRVFHRSEGQTPSTFRRSYARLHMNTQ